MVAVCIAPLSPLLLLVVLAALSGFQCVLMQVGCPCLPLVWARLPLPRLPKQPRQREPQHPRLLMQLGQLQLQR